MKTNKILTKKVHKSKMLVILTVAVLILLISTEIFFLVQVFIGDIPYLFSIELSLIIALSIIISYGYAPLTVTLSESSLVLRRGIGRKQFNYSDIEYVEAYDNKKIAARLCGIGGLFGFIGRYYTEGIGHYFSYVGDYSQAFYFQLKSGKKYMLSCEDREQVISLIREKISCRG